MRYKSGMSQSLFRHIEACNNTPSPNHLLPFRFGAEQVGWVSAELARALTFFPRDFHFEGRGISMAGRLRTPGMRSDALATTARELAKQGFGRVRGELFDIRAEANGPVLGTLDRGLIPQFGIIGQGVHLNGLVRRA
ncbi:MAG: hydrolase, partial [Rubritepida sp.]|nr:hydrolase [Rubritepida sp.]